MKEIPEVIRPRAVIIGALNLDLIIKGLPKFASPGEQVNGQSLELSPGGKGRNLATMLAPWLEPGQVSMISKLVCDQYGLYRIPLQSLEKAGIITDHIMLASDRQDDLPTLAIFLNTLDGQRANYYLPGDNETLEPELLERVRPLLMQLADNNGFLILTLELPLATACHALSIASEYNLRVILDPGGQPPEADVDYTPLLKYPIFLIKPNALEAEQMTGMSVVDFASAQIAADKLMKQNVKHVLITHGRHGAYAFTDGQDWHIPLPKLAYPSHADSTGCGDQVLAVLCAEILNGAAFEAACRKAIMAGSLQYRQSGKTPIQPDNSNF